MEGFIQRLWDLFRLEFNHVPIWFDTEDFLHLFFRKMIEKLNIWIWRQFYSEGWPLVSVLTSELHFFDGFWLRRAAGTANSGQRFEVVNLDTME